MAKKLKKQCEGMLVKISPSDEIYFSKNLFGEELKRAMKLCPNCFEDEKSKKQNKND